MAADIEFVKNDEILRVAIPLLSEFGSTGRYYHMNALADPIELDDGSPERRWDDVLGVVADVDEFLEMEAQQRTRELIPPIIGSFERLLRCASRSIHFDPEMSREVKSFSNYMAATFLMIRDREFGQRTYPQFSAL